MAEPLSLPGSPRSGDSTQEHSDRSDAERVAVDLIVSLGLLRRTIGAANGSAADRLSFAEIAVLARLERTGPATSAEVARCERVTPQSMGATLHALERRNLVVRQRDQRDRRRVVFTTAETGQWRRRLPDAADSQWLAQELSSCSETELEQLRLAAELIERLSQAR